MRRENCGSGAASTPGRAAGRSGPVAAERLVSRCSRTESCCRNRHTPPPLHTARRQCYSGRICGGNDGAQWARGRERPAAISAAIGACPRFHSSRGEPEQLQRKRCNHDVWNGHLHSEEQLECEYDERECTPGCSSLSFVFGADADLGVCDGIRFPFNINGYSHSERRSSRTDKHSVAGSIIIISESTRNARAPPFPAPAEPRLSPKQPQYPFPRQCHRLHRILHTRIAQRHLPILRLSFSSYRGGTRGPLIVGTVEDSCAWRTWGSFAAAARFELVDPRRFWSRVRCTRGSSGNSRGGGRHGCSTAVGPARAEDRDVCTERQSHRSVRPGRIGRFVGRGKGERGSRGSGGSRSSRSSGGGGPGAAVERAHAGGGG